MKAILTAWKVTNCDFCCLSASLIDYAAGDLLHSRSPLSATKNPTRMS